ncbi:MAG: hypothetical protein U1F60_10340 [Planctomycetota bacterium]
MPIRTLPLLFAALPLAAQTLTFAEGAPTALTIVSVAENDPNGGDTVVLAGLELLPIEMTCRTLAQEADPTRSRLVDRNGLPRIELPSGGRLLRYRRNGGQFYGFLRIAADGGAHVVFERAGVGALLEDPFFDRIGVSPDGRHAAFALQSGGLRVAKLDGTVWPSTGSVVRTAAPSNLEVLPLSVTVGNDAVWFQADDVALRIYGCALTDGAPVVDVSPTLLGSGDFKDQMAITPDGHRVVFLYGPNNLQSVYSATLAGGPVQLPPVPSKYEEPGYLPENAGEPAMLLNDTGTRLFFVEGLVRDELQMLDLTGSSPTLAITESAIFQPYIGSHILPKFFGDKLTVAIGDPAAMDWFRAELSAGGGQVVNLTGTGSLQQPFPSGTLSPVHSMRVAGALVLSEFDAGTLKLRAMDPTSGATLLQLAGLVEPPLLGDGRVQGADVVVRATDGDRLYLGDSGLLFAAAPAGYRIGPVLHGPLFSATSVVLPAGERLPVFYLPDGFVAFGSAEAALQQIVLTPANGIVLVGPTLRYVSPTGSVTLNRPTVAVRQLLSGIGI